MGQVLWGIEAFFDSFAETDVTRMAVRLGYPKRLLLLALQQHTAPRIVAAMGAADEEAVGLGGGGGKRRSG